MNTISACMVRHDGGDLRRDQSGAVVLIALFMSVFLVGVLWYLMGTGDAIIYRENMQDGADATAYAAAVYDARGMNVISMINLIMAAILGVLVALKIAQVLLVTTNILSCLCSALSIGGNPICDGVCGQTTSFEPKMQNAINRVQNVVDKALVGLHTAASGVAVGMPWVAEIKSVIVAHEYGPTMQGGFTMSISQLPGAVISKAGNVITGESGSGPAPASASTSSGGSSGGGTSSGGSSGSGSSSSGGSSGSSSSGEMRFGLPVSDAKPVILCHAAGKFVVDIVLSPFDQMGGWASKAKGFIANLVSNVVSTFPGYFCDMGGLPGSSGNSAVANATDPATVCAQQKQQIDDWNAQHPNNKQIYNEAQCLQKAQQSINKSQQNAGKAASGATTSSTDPKKKTSKRVYTIAWAGSDYFTVYSLGWGDLSKQSPAKKGVDLATWGRSSADDPGLMTKFTMAKSEFYFDRGIGEFLFKTDDPTASQSFPDDAVWNMRWRARLRRTRAPIPEFGGLLAKSINDQISTAAKNGLGGLSQSWPIYSIISDIQGWVKTNVGKPIDNGVNGWVGDHGGLVGSGSYTVVH